jgi:hypothetical protein
MTTIVAGLPVIPFADDETASLMCKDPATGDDSQVLVKNLGFTPEGVGAVPQGLQDHLRSSAIQLISFVPTAMRAAVLNFTSGADMTPYIQACVDAAKGRFIYAMAGRWHVHSSIFSGKPIRMFGDGNGCGPGPSAIANTECTQFHVNFSAGDVFYVESNYPSVFRDFQILTAVANRPRTSGAGIHISGPPGSTNANSMVQGVGMSVQYDCVKLTRCVMSRITDNYFDWWERSGVIAQTTAGIEGGGGLIQGNYFFGKSGSTSQLSCITLQVGYTWVTNNLILGAAYGVQVAIAAHPAGSIHINDNWIENQGTAGVLAVSIDGNASSMVKIHRNEFSNIEFTSAFAASIVVGDYNLGTDWLDDLEIASNVHRHSLSVNHRVIWVQSGRTVSIHHEQIENIGAGASTTGIDCTTFAGAALKDVAISENKFRGTFALGKYRTNAASTVVDLFNKLTVAELPSPVANGSFIYAANGNTGSPVTSGGPGCFAYRRGGVWRSP